MEKTVTFPNGKKVIFKMTKEKGFFTDHIWLYRDGKPYLHITPNKENNSASVSKNCEGIGYLQMCELVKPFESITIDDICHY